MTTSAIAQGGSGPTFGAFGASWPVSTVLTDKAYATTLIDGASKVADVLLGPQDVIFGTVDQFGGGAVSATFDFRFRGDLLFGVIDGFDFDIIVNGVQIFTGGSVPDAVIDLGSNFGPNIDLTIAGEGDFVVGGLVSETPVREPSTWATMLLGFAGVGFVGYRASRRCGVSGLDA